jgi:hypothetical protein
MLKSVLVKLSPAGVGTGESKDDTTVSVDTVFMATYSSFQYKVRKYYFCIIVGSFFLFNNNLNIRN